MFLLNQIIVSPFVHIFDIISLFAAESEDLKIAIWSKGLTFRSTQDIFQIVVKYKIYVMNSLLCDGSLCIIHHTIAIRPLLQRACLISFLYLSDWLLLEHSRQELWYLCAMIWHTTWNLTRSQTTNFRLFQTGRLSRQQFWTWWKWQKVFQMDRKHCGKRRNCSLWAISPFPTVFVQDLFCRHVKTRERVNIIFTTQSNC